MVNRYTSLSASGYNPLSLDEMMMVPLAKQKRQDDLLSQSDFMSDKLANLKRLQGDDEYATDKIKGYSDQLNQISDKIANEGINKQTTRNFRKLFNNYNFSMSDSGDLGKIQNNYIAAKQKEQAFRNQMQKLGHTEEYINTKIKQGYDQFTTIGDDGSFNEFQDFQGGKFYDPRLETMQYMKTLPYNQRTLIQKGIRDGEVIQLDNGMLKVLRSKDGLLKENVNQVNAGIEGLIKSYNQGDRKDFKDFYFPEEGSLEEHIKTTAKPYIFRQQVDPKDTSYYMNGTKDSKSKVAKKEKIDTHGLIGDIGTTTRYFGGRDYKGILDNIQILKENNNHAEARRLENHLDNVERSFKETGIYKTYTNRMTGYIDENGNKVEGLNDKVAALAGAYDRLRLIGTGGAQNPDLISNDTMTAEELVDPNVEELHTRKYTIRDSAFGYNTPQLSEDENGENYTTLQTEKGIRTIPTELWNEIKSHKDLKKIYDKVFQDNIDNYAANTREYQFKTLSSKERSTINNQTKQVFRNFNTDKFVISGASKFDKESNEELLVTDIENPLTQKRLFNMFQFADTKVELNKYTGMNTSGNPGVNVTVTYKTKEDGMNAVQTYNMWVDLKEFRSTTGNLQSSNHIFTNMLEQYGGVDGKNISAKMKQRDRYKDIQPTFAKDYAISDNIKSKINPNLASVFNDVDLDIIKQGDEYILMAKNKVMHNTNSQVIEGPLNWSNFIKLADSDNTVNLLKMTPSLAKKLVEDVRMITGRNITDLENEGVLDEALKELARNKINISARDSYDLMDLISN